MRWRLILGLSGVLVIIATLVWQLLLVPSHEREWQEHYAQTPGATVEDEVVRLHNVRHWTHDVTGVTGREWVDEVVIDPAEIVQVWFVLSLFGDSAYTGHSFLSFELVDGRAYTFSIEARREVGEDYGAVRGMLRTYELWYGWGTEQDFLGASFVLLGRPLEMYPLVLSPEERSALFRVAALATSHVASQPRFYNTLTANCTNLLAKAINTKVPGTIPYDLAWNLPGLAPAFLAEEGYIEVVSSTTPLRAQYRLDTPTPQVVDALQSTPEAFSQALRESFRL